MVRPGDVYRSGLFLGQVDYLAGGLPFYAILRTELRFEEARAIIEEIVVCDHTDDGDPSVQPPWSATYEARDDRVVFRGDDGRALVARMPAPGILTFVDAGMDVPGVLRSGALALQRA